METIIVSVDRLEVLEWGVEALEARLTRLYPETTVMPALVADGSYCRACQEVTSGRCAQHATVLVNPGV